MFPIEIAMGNNGGYLCDGSPYIVNLPCLIKLFAIFIYAKPSLPIVEGSRKS